MLNGDDNEIGFKTNRSDGHVLKIMIEKPIEQV